MKIILTILLIYIDLQSYSQNQEINNVINQAINEIVPSDFRYFNLVDSSMEVKFDNNSLDRHDSFELSKLNILFDKEYFAQQANLEQRINWNNFRIERARIYSIDSIPKFYSSSRTIILINRKQPKHYIDSLTKCLKYSERIILINPRWHEKKIKSSISKQLQEHDDKILKEDKKHFRFSIPIFSKDFNLCLISYSNGEGGGSLIFKKENQHWIKAYGFNYWSY